jgi:catalase
MSRSWRLASVWLASLWIVAAASAQAADGMQPSAGNAHMSQDQLYEALLDALYATFGNYPGFRVAHAKGVLVSGVFTATPEAKQYSRAAHLQGEPIPVLLRFSNFSGVPATADGDPMASPYGLAIRFTLPNGVSDIVAHSFNGFPVSTPEDFLVFLQGIAASGGESPNSAALDAFLAGHPQAKSFLEVPKPVPHSYAGLSFYGVNAFVFENNQGQQQAVRYRIEPEQPELPAQADEVANWDADHLQIELAQRLAKGGLHLRLVAQLAESGDKIADGSVAWPQSNKSVVLGVFTLKELLPPDRQLETQQALDFNPARLPDGIKASADPMISARQHIYEKAMMRRNSL